MSAPVQNVEVLFLKIFKVTVLVIMGLALIAILYFLANASYQYSQSPKEPAPAQKAPPKEIRLDGLKDMLIEDGKRRDGKTEKVQPVAMATTIEYRTEADLMYECKGNFANAVGTPLPEAGNNSAMANEAERLRQKLEEFAKQADYRGAAWVKAVAAFTCAAMKDQSLMTLQKENKITRPFTVSIEFHAARWDEIEIEKRRFEQAEQARVNGERAAELARVAVAKAQAVAHMTAALIAFAVFMALALYLVFAKIETNLRDINGSIRSAGKLSSQ